MVDKPPRTAGIREQNTYPEWPYNWPSGSSAGLTPPPGAPVDLYWCGVATTTTPPTRTLIGSPLIRGAFYFATDTSRPYVWDGQSWVSFRQGGQSRVSRLVYDMPPGQTVYDLNVPDKYGNNYTLALAPSPLEPVNIFMNGVRMLVGDQIAGVTGDVTVNPQANTVVFTNLVPAGGDILEVDILLPNEYAVPTSIDVEHILDLDVDWADPTRPPGQIDGVRTTFTLYVDDKSVPSAITPAGAVTAGAESVEVFVGGVRQVPGTDYTTLGSQLRFTEAPPANAAVWALWYVPKLGGSGGGQGVLPPVIPLDQTADTYKWLPGLGATWIDGRADYRSVANWGLISLLRDPEDVKEGSLVYQEDSGVLHLRKNHAWVELMKLPRPTPVSLTAPNPTVQRLEYDPTRIAGDRLVWKDDREVLTSVDTLTDLYAMDFVHANTGKLVYVKADGRIYEMIAGPTTYSGTAADWKPMVGGVTFVAREGNLPTPATTTMVDGQMFCVKMDNAGNDLMRLVVWDSTKPAPASFGPTSFAFADVEANLPVGQASTAVLTITSPRGASNATATCNVTVTTDAGVFPIAIPMAAGETNATLASKIAAAWNATPGDPDVTAVARRNIVTFTGDPGTPARAARTLNGGTFGGSVSSAAIALGALSGGVSPGDYFVNSSGATFNLPDGTPLPNNRAVVVDTATPLVYHVADADTPLTPGTPQQQQASGTGTLVNSDADFNAWLQSNPVAGDYAYNEDSVTHSALGMTIGVGRAAVMTGAAGVFFSTAITPAPAHGTLPAAGDIPAVAFTGPFTAPATPPVVTIPATPQVDPTTFPNFTATVGNVGRTTTATSGGYRFLNRRIWNKGLRADPDQASDEKHDDLQITREDKHEEIKSWNELTRQWDTIYSRDEIDAAIAALSLFEGTVHEVGGTAVGAVDFAALPDLTAAMAPGGVGLSKNSHYWTFIGTPNYAITTATPIIGNDLDGAVLNPGDWVQIANRGGDGTGTGTNGGPPDLHWVTIGGDLLAKVRADRLFGLQPWSAGGWEQGSIVNFNGDVYRASRPVTRTDANPNPPVAQISFPAPATFGSHLDGTPTGDFPAPATRGMAERATANGTTPGGVNYATGDEFVYHNNAGFGGDGTTIEGFPYHNGWIKTGQTPAYPLRITPAPATPWVRVDISGGLKISQTDTGLPATAPAGQVWIVLQSARAGGVQALYGYDPGARRWVALGGGGGIPMTLDQGDEIISLGVPVGAVMMYVDNAAPKGWLRCDGSAYDATAYPELNTLLGRAVTPDLSGLFVRGGTADPWTHHQDTTRLPRNPFRADAAGSHTHAYHSGHGSTAGISGGHWHVGEIGYGDVRNTTLSEGAHIHNIIGGDPETAPKHVILSYWIKGKDFARVVH